MINIQNAEEEFKKYTNKFDHTNEKITIKIEHTYRVEKISKTIAENLNLDEENIQLATLIGLLHDIGRFEQVKRYNSFSDLETEDHASLGVEILKKDKYISKYAKEKYWNTIFNAVENHNKLYIDSSLNQYDTMHSKIIRDADKIDIINLYINRSNTDPKCEGKYINEKIVDVLKNKKMIEKKDKKYPGDGYFLALGFVYDFNYKISYKILKEKDYINKLIDGIIRNCTDEKEKQLLEDVRPLLNSEIEKNIKKLKE